MIFVSKEFISAIIMLLCMLFFQSCFAQKRCKDALDFVKNQDSLSFVEEVISSDTLNTCKLSFKLNYNEPSFTWEYLFFRYINYILSKEYGLKERAGITIYFDYYFRGYTKSSYKTVIVKGFSDSNKFNFLKYALLNYDPNDFNYLDSTFCEVSKCENNNNKVRYSGFFKFLKDIFNKENINLIHYEKIKKMKDKIKNEDKKHLINFFKRLKDAFPSNEEKIYIPPDE